MDKKCNHTISVRYPEVIVIKLGHCLSKYIQIWPDVIARLLLLTLVNLEQKRRVASDELINLFQNIYETVLIKH